MKPRLKFNAAGSFLNATAMKIPVIITFYYKRNSNKIIL